MESMEVHGPKNSHLPVLIMPASPTAVPQTRGFTHCEIWLCNAIKQAGAQYQALVNPQPAIVTSTGPVQVVTDSGLHWTGNEQVMADNQPTTVMVEECTALSVDALNSTFQSLDIVCTWACEQAREAGLGECLKWCLCCPYVYDRILEKIVTESL